MNVVPHKDVYWISKETSLKSTVNIFLSKVCFLKIHDFFVRSSRDFGSTIFQWFFLQLKCGISTYEHELWAKFDCHSLLSLHDGAIGASTSALFPSANNFLSVRDWDWAQGELGRTSLGLGHLGSAFPAVGENNSRFTNMGIS